MVQQWAPSPEGCLVVVAMVVVTAARKVPVVVNESWMVRRGARVVLEQACEVVQSVVVVATAARKVPLVVNDSWMRTALLFLLVLPQFPVFSFKRLTLPILQMKLWRRLGRTSCCTFVDVCHPCGSAHTVYI